MARISAAPIIAEMVKNISGEIFIATHGSKLSLIEKYQQEMLKET
jgi:hypothetical protein